MQWSKQKNQHFFIPFCFYFYSWLSALESTKWLHHLSVLLKSALLVVHAVDRDQRPVLVHCSDGWDRTPQIVALAKLLLDPYYRTIEVGTSRSRFWYFRISGETSEAFMISFGHVARSNESEFLCFEIIASLSWAKLWWCLPQFLPLKMEQIVDNRYWEYRHLFLCSLPTWKSFGYSRKMGLLLKGLGMLLVMGIEITTECSVEKALLWNNHLLG